MIIGYGTNTTLLREALSMRHPLLSVIVFSLLPFATRAQTSFTVGGGVVNVTTIAESLDVPWDMVLGPDGHLWFTEANGNVYRMDLSTYELQLVHTVENVTLAGFTAGLHSMAFHPDFNNEPYVYLHYMNSTTTSVVERFAYDAGSNTFGPGSGHLLSVSIPGGASHNGSRMVADDSGNFILTMGDHMTGSANVQNPAMIEGKFLRFDPLGGIPVDNPVAGSYLYNWGHRNPQGLVHANNGIWYNTAHGQNNDDEVNIVLPNRNYGWPTVLGLCNTPTEQAYCSANDVVEPIHEFTLQVVAPAGIDHYAHAAIPGWQNSLLVATLRGKALWQLQLDATGTNVTGATPFLTDQFGRLRDVQVLPDGSVLVCTSNRDWSGAPKATDDRILLLTPEVSTGITSYTVQAPWLAPNPAADRAMLSLPNEACTVTVLDATGRALHNWTSEKGSVELPASILPNGSYHIHVSAVGRNWYLPWMVSK